MTQSPFRVFVILCVAIAGILFALPSFLPEDVRDNWPGFLPRQTVVLGLDLQGGSHLLLQVNQDGIVSERLQTLRRDVRNTLANQNGIGNLITTDPATRTLTIELTDPSQKPAAKAAVEALQNAISSSMLSVGGVDELAFGETPDGKRA